MAFMKPFIEYGAWLEIDGDCGTTYLPMDVSPMTVDDLTRAAEEGDVTAYAPLLDYYEGSRIYSVEVIRGYGARLSAPGYLDATEWTVFDTLSEAEEHLKEMYGDDD